MKTTRDRLYNEGTKETGPRDVVDFSRAVSVVRVCFFVYFYCY